MVSIKPVMGLTVHLYNGQKRSLSCAIAVDLCAARVPLAGVIWFSPVPYLGGTLKDFLADPPPPFIRGLLNTGIFFQS
jgi:hypothetical protein